MEAEVVLGQRIENPSDRLIVASVERGQPAALIVHYDARRGNARRNVRHGTLECEPITVAEEWDLRLAPVRLGSVGLNLERALREPLGVRVVAQRQVSQRVVAEQEDVARIELERALHLRQCTTPVSQTPINVRSRFEHLGIRG